MERTPAGESARALILATERMIALHGSAGVSLRQINAAAKVRNSSAVRYHFGTRDDLMLAVYRHRIEPVNARRMAMLDALERAGDLLDARKLIGAVVRPLADELKPRPEGNYYLRFLEHSIRERGGSAVGRIAGTLREGWLRADTHLRAVIRHLPDDLVDLRLRMVRDQTVSTLASIEARLEHGIIPRTSLPLQIEALIDAVTISVCGPVSTETKALLDPVHADKAAERVPPNNGSGAPSLVGQSQSLSDD